MEFFDLLPVELLHMIFSFLSASNIVKAFDGLSQSIDAVLDVYDRYTANFTSVSQLTFDRTLSRLKVNQIISLTLFDDQNTPGQLQLFFKNYHLADFHCLRSLSLGMNTHCSYERYQATILSRFTYQLESCDHLKITHLRMVGFDKKLNKAEFLRFVPYVEKLYLPDLCLDYSDIPSFDRLRSLNAHNLPLHKILPFAAAITNLTGSIIQSTAPIKFDQLPLLSRLHLWVHFYFTMDDMCETLASCVNLKRLEIKTGAANYHVADGARWEALISSSLPQLQTFTLHLWIGDGVGITLDSFRTPFWLETKRWYMAIGHSHLFSVPSTFTCLTFPGTVIEDTTAPNDHILYANVNEIRIELSTNVSKASFSDRFVRDSYTTERVWPENLTSSNPQAGISLAGITLVEIALWESLKPIDILFYGCTFDASVVRRLHLTYFPQNIQSIYDLLDLLPKLQHLEAKDFRHLLDRQGPRFLQIRTIHFIYKRTNMNTSKLFSGEICKWFCESFPSLAHLCVQVQEWKEALDYIKALPHLASANFLLAQKPTEDEKTGYRHSLADAGRTNFSIRSFNICLQLWLGDMDLHTSIPHGFSDYIQSENR